MQPSFIASFVLRLFREQAGEAQALRVLVRQVQTGEERQFHRLEEALAFIEEAASQPCIPNETDPFRS